MAKKKGNKKKKGKTGNAGGAGNSTKSDRQRMVEQARRSSMAAQKKKKKEPCGAFWNGVRREMSKVVWPTREELGVYTVVVLVTCAVFTLGFFLLDHGFLALMYKTLGINLASNIPK